MRANSSYHKSQTFVPILNKRGNVSLRRNQKIPYTIIQTFKYRRVPISMRHNLSKWITMNPEYDYVFFDDNDIKHYISNHSFKEFTFSKDKFIYAYNKIIPGAGKADLFRYLIMYDKGGCYMDIDTTCLCPLSHFIEPDDEVVSGIGERGDFHQWGLIYTPKHPFMKMALEIAVNNIIYEQFIYNTRSLEYLCGPPCLDIAIKRILHLEQTYRFTSGKYLTHNITYTLLKGDFFDNNVAFKYKDYKKDLSSLHVNYWANQPIFHRASRTKKYN